MRRLAQAPPTPFIDGRKSVASRAHANMHATTNGGRNPRSGSSLPRRTIALGYSPRPCAGSRKHRRPRLSMFRKSVASHAHTNMRATTEGAEIQGPVAACPVAPSLSATPPDRAPARASTADPIYRWSKIGRVARPRQYACNDRGGRNPKVRQTPCPAAPSLSATPPDRAPARASTADPVYRWFKIGRVVRPREQCKHRCDRISKVR
jgi:hypothetical protein